MSKHQLFFKIRTYLSYYNIRYKKIIIIIMIKIIKFSCDLKNNNKRITMSGLWFKIADIIRYITIYDLRLSIVVTIYVLLITRSF